MHEIENYMCRNDLEGIENMDNIKTALANPPPKVTVAVLRFKLFNAFMPFECHSDACWALFEKTRHTEKF